jgi:hypothetical protein
VRIGNYNQQERRELSFMNLLLFLRLMHLFAAIILSGRRVEPRRSRSAGRRRADALHDGKRRRE